MDLDMIERYGVELGDLVDGVVARELVERLNKMERRMPKEVRRAWWLLSNAYQVVTNSSSSASNGTVTFSSSASSTQ